MIVSFNNRKFTVRALIGISLLYFILFIPINFSGSNDIGKIRVLSNIDESAQLHALEQMLSPEGKTFKRKIADYLLHHHAYGYPFYFISSLPVIPIKLLDLPRSEELKWMMLLLRQQVVFFNILICLLITYLWTQFKPILPTFLLFLFLLSVPAVVKHNLLWHPDALSSLFFTLTLFCLTKDKLQFKKWFVYAAITCGMTCSTKFVGPFLFLLIICYLLFAIKKTQLSYLFIFKQALIFFGLTLLTFLLSSPLIIFGYYENIVSFLTHQSQMNNFGWGIKLPKGLLPWYQEVIKPYYFHGGIILVILGAIIVSLMKLNNKRMLNIISLASVIPLFLYVIFVVAHKNYFYLYPVLLIFGSMLYNLYYLREYSYQNILFAPKFKNVKMYFSVFLFGFMIFIIYLNLSSSYSIYRNRFHVIETHPSFRFYERIAAGNLLSAAHSEKPVKVLQTAFIYLPDSLNLEIIIPNGFINMDILNKEKPRYVLLEKELALNITDENFQKQYFNLKEVKTAAVFFKHALQNSLAGYALRYVDEYGLLLEKTNGL